MKFHTSPFSIQTSIVYSESAVDRVRLLFAFLLQSLSHLLPHLAATVRIEPDQLLLSYVDHVDAAPGAFGVNEGQADGKGSLKSEG